ncbi:MAG TPA: bifunctional hydroxymethylpyrimidine kinase/phosphomethylpyrimidine kinase [Hellea balneolensis]|uniref:hydroxymethylpyrimidine kinase n=1 Tax=Hellea balneolensis TaxID=287478 RepID=A0A7C3C4Z3_9PROT|nr:bifunctional hydroxymethylpyrimidine kinase/phosphomethylpyrimidine kinase [Hellea balneolensis]
MSKTARVLIVAGSDSGGGAGVQADIKTCAAFGAYSGTAITAITVQNTQSVSRVEALCADLVAEQMRSFLGDIGADVIKIGMLANDDIIDAVADVILTEAEDITVVLDPVLVATSGDTLLDEDAISTLKNKLLPLADVLTPNTYEAEILSGVKIETLENMIKAGEALMELGAYHVLMKGGHMEGKSITDILLTPEGNQIMNAPRIHSRHTHGTGCTLASAVAAGLALGEDINTAVAHAREFVFEAIKTAPGLGSGHGPLNHGLNLGDAQKTPQDDAPKNNPFAALKDLKT